MIDDKKIQAAAKETFANVRNSKDNVCMKVGFLSGVKWFKEAIWHDASEKPKENERIITEFRDNGVSYELDIPYENWECYCAFNDILRWCYLSDILPKGGEK